MSKRKTQTATAELPADQPIESPTATNQIQDATASPEATLLAQDTGPAADRPNVTRASVLSDVQAGVRFHFDYEKHRGEIVFDTKPGAEILSFLRDNGFEWDREAKVWQRPIRFQQREQDRLAAKRTYHKAAGMVRKEKGIEQSSPPLPD